MYWKESWIDHDGYMMNVFGRKKWMRYLFSTQYGPAQLRSFSIYHLSVTTYNMLSNNMKNSLLGPCMFISAADHRITRCPSQRVIWKCYLVDGSQVQLPVSGWKMGVNPSAHLIVGQLSGGGVAGSHLQVSSSGW